MRCSLEIVQKVVIALANKTCDIQGVCPKSNAPHDH